MESVAHEEEFDGKIVTQEKQIGDETAAGEKQVDRETVEREKQVGGETVALRRELDRNNKRDLKVRDSINKNLKSQQGPYFNRRRKKLETVRENLAPVVRTSLLKLISIREDRLLQSTDHFEKLDLINSSEELKGTSYLWKTHVLPAQTRNTYRPLVTQGETIGETAQTLWKNEYYFTVFGTIGYGVTDTISASANLAGFLLGSPNAKLKNQVFRNSNQTWSVSLSMAQERNSSEKLFNIDLMWDSILTDSLIAHSLISAAVISFDSAKEVAALKSYGSSSIQTGYEYIFSNWSRFLIGHEAFYFLS